MARTQAPSPLEHPALGSAPATDADALDADQRGACAVVADLLAGGRLWSLPSLAGIAVAGWTVPQLQAWPLPLRAATLLALGLLLAAERYLAVRVALDARLFDRLARGAAPGGLDSLAALDRALVHQLGMPPAKAGRPLAPRLAGARRLYRLHWSAALLCVAQAGWRLWA